MKALIIVDMQLDFMPGGKLPVPGGWDLEGPILRAAGGYEVVVATEDYHPSDHCSFAAQGGPWPEHCVRGSLGARLVAGIADYPLNAIIRKGRSRTADSYSAFADDSGIVTGLHYLLDGLRVSQVDICGVEWKHCVRATALDAVRFGLPNVRVLRDLVGVLDPATVEPVSKELAAAMVEVV